MEKEENQQIQSEKETSVENKNTESTENLETEKPQFENESNPIKHHITRFYLSHCPRRGPLWTRGGGY